jgi:hypothetical protein
MGLGIADDDAIGSHIMPPPSLATDRLDRLKPKTFRFQIYWDAVDDPNSTTDFVDRARKQIERVRAAGVQQVVATFKKHNNTPTVTQYKIGIWRVVEALGDQVDVWGPANEPNAGEGWLPGVSGAAQLAGFNTALAEVVTQFDPTALRTSPDFIDRCTPAASGPNRCTTQSLESLETYISAYLAAGGGWGHYAAIHAYGGIRHKTRETLDSFASLVPAGKDIWITEVGGFGCGQNLNEGPIVGNQRVNWMLNGEPGNGGLASHPRVARIYHYHMRSGGGPCSSSNDWDTALLNNNLTPRPAWYTWCAASHGDNPSHPDCVDPPSEQPLARIAAYPGGGNHFVYSRSGSSNAIKQTQWDSSTGLWHITPLGGMSAGESAAYSTGNNHYTYFRGLNGAIWQWLWDSGTAQWHLTELGGSAAGQPTAYSSGGNHYVYFRGTNGAIWQYLWDSATGLWHLTQLGGSAASEPTAYTAGGTHYVYFRGWDGAIWQLYSSNGLWHLYRLGGAAAGAPTGYPSGSNHFLYFRGANGAIWQYLWDQGTGQWHLTQLGGAAASEPTAYMSGTSHNVYFRGTDGAIWQYLWYPGGGQWHLTRLGGSATGSPTGYASGSSHYVYFRGANGGIWQYLWYPGGGQWYLTQIAQE